MPNTEYMDVQDRSLKRFCHVQIIEGHFRRQEGVVVTFDKHQPKEEGSVVVYMRNAPDDLFMIDGQCVVRKEHRSGIPPESEWQWNPLAISFDGNNLQIIGEVAPSEMIGTPQQAEVRVAKFDKKYSATRNTSAKNAKETVRHPELKLV